MKPHALGTALLALSVLAVASGAQEAPRPAPDAPLRYGRIARPDAVVRNLADKKSVELAKLGKGEIVAVYQERAGWLEIEVPGGLAVWVYGRYLKPTDTPDVYEVVRNGVNMRPQPKAEVDNFPLPQRLHAQDRVRGIEVLDPSAPLEKTWVRIWSPRGVHAYVRAADVGDLAAGEDGEAAWKAAEKALAARGRSAPPTRVAQERAAEEEAAAAGEPDAGERARQALERGRQALAQEEPDLARARAAFEEVQLLGGDTAAVTQASLELVRVSILEEKQRLEADLEAERERILEETREREARVREASRRKDPLGGVFQARGVLVRRVEADRGARYFVRWGGELTAELLCSSGRYSLADFAGYEIGVHGEEQRGPAGETRLLPLLDVGRIEVISRR